MNKTQKTLGMTLQERRQEMNYSLKEIETATSIRLNYLKAIEQDDFSQLISNVYAKGFVKQYATFLGLDSEKLFRDYAIAFDKVEKRNFTYGIGTLEVRTIGNHGVKWIPNALWITTTVCILVIGWVLIKYFQLF